MSLSKEKPLKSEQVKTSYLRLTYISSIFANNVTCIVKFKSEISSKNFSSIKHNLNEYTGG